MKKITTILMLLMLTCMGAQAQTDDSWPINFPKDQTFTRTDRHINNVKFNDQTIDGLYVDQNTLCYQDLTATKTVTLPANTTIKPSFNVAGGWQHGFVYIDLNNDGDFTDEGELVAKSPTEGSPNLATDIAEFTSPATEGTYRMRVKTDWASEDPGGNPGPNNYIIDNGGQIVDLTLEIIATTPEQEAAYAKIGEWLPLLQNQALVTDASNYLSNAKQGDEGSYAALLDKNNSTYFHSQWSGAMVNVPGHDLQARLPEAVDAFHLFYVTRSTGTGYPTGFRIDGSNNADDFSEAGGSSWTEDVASVTENLPAGATKSYMSDVISMSSSYQYLRFVPTIGNNQGKNWFCLAEFWLFPSNETVDAAIEMMKNVNSVFDITNDMVATINQIDADLRSTTVNVTYNFVVDGTTVESIVVTQAKNSAVSIPVDLTKGYSSMGYDFVPEGTIGTTDCVITVTATPKEGVVTDLANLSNEKAYMLTTARGSLGTNGTQMVSTNGTSYSASDFAIVSYEGKYYLWSVADSKWVANKTQPTLTEDLSEVGALVLDPTSIDKPLYFIGMGTNGVNIAGGYGTGVVVNTWTTRDDGNKYIIKENGNFDPTNAISALDAYFHPSYTITYIVNDESGNELFRSEPVGTSQGANITTLPEEYQLGLFYSYNTVDVTISNQETEIVFTATPKEDAPFQFTADTSAPVWYNLTIRPDNSANTAYPTFVDGGTPNVTLPATMAEDETTQWAFIGSPYAGFQVVNKAAGTSLVLGSASAKNDGNSGGNTHATLASPGSQTYEVWTVTENSNVPGGFFMNNAEGDYLNRRSNANLAYWTGGHDIGSTFVAAKVLTDDEKYNELIALLESYPFGTGTNQYNLTLEGADQTENAKNLLQNLKDAGYSEDNKAELDKIVAGMSLNMPKAGFYPIKGQNSGMYLAAGLAENNKFAMTDAVDATTIFCFDGTKLINYSNGMVNGMSASSWAWVYGDGAASEVTFQDGLTKGGYGIKSSTANFYDNGDSSASADRGGNVTINENTNSRYTSWYLEEVPELPITLSLADDGKYYAVFSAPVAASEVIGASVNGVTVSGNQAVYKEVTGGIPADKGVLLIGDSDEAIVILGEYTGDEIESDLTPITAAESSSTALFLDPDSTDPFGFYELDGATGGFTASAPNDGTNTILELVNSNTTGIENIENGAFENGAVYNLQGQKVNKAQKGVFIQNGKKVVVR